MPRDSNNSTTERTGKGALIYTGHFGNFPLMGIWLALKGYPVGGVYKEASNFPGEFFGNIFRKFNMTPLKYKSDAALTISIIKALNEWENNFDRKRSVTSQRDLY